MTRVPSFQLFLDDDFIATIPINRATFLIGRKNGMHLRLMEGSVSREHLKVTLQGEGKFSLEDLNSTNGTTVNRSRIVQHTLAAGDVVTVGRLTLVFTELVPAKLNPKGSGLLGRWLAPGEKIAFSPPCGEYVLPQDDTVTEFDAVSYAMVRHQQSSDDEAEVRSGFLRKIPRLRASARPEAPHDHDVTKFFVSQNVFKGMEALALKTSADPMAVFAQPEVRGKGWKIPWKWIEIGLVPLLLAGVITVVARNLLSFHIGSELSRAEKHWNERLQKVADQFKYAPDEVFEAAPAAAPPRTFATARAVPLSDAEVWRRINATPALRNYLLFEILDEVLTESDLKWSLDQTLKNLPKMATVTTRLPSVKKFQIVYEAEAAPTDLAQIRQSRVFFLAERQAAEDMQRNYSEYRSDLGPRLSVIQTCAGARKKSFAEGKVVLGFTVGNDGRIRSVFINEARSSREPKLWNCVRSRLATLKLDPPPGGSLSILYTFSFAPPTTVEF